jgi:hypothetical protein
MPSTSFFDFISPFKHMIFHYISKTSVQQSIHIQNRRFSAALRMSLEQNSKGQGVSHATTSSVPQTLQEKVPKSVEDKIPDSAHDTGANEMTGKVSHATGPKGSKVPKVSFSIFL